ncbi:MAG: TonB family protein [Hyphomicrobiaceae bacterium]
MSPERTDTKPRPMLEHVKPSDLTAVPEPSGNGPGLAAPDVTELMREQAVLQRGDARRHRGALICAGALHLALLAAMAASWTRDPIGSSGQSLEAISVEIALVPSIGLTAAAPEPAPADAPPSPTPAAALPSASAPPPPVQPTEKATDAPPAPPLPPPTIVAKPDPAPAEPETPAIEIREITTVAPSPVTTPITAKAQAEAAATGAPARPISSAPAAAARASPREVQAYARSIVAALDQSRPKSAPGLVRGTVKIAFLIAQSGDLDDVRVAKSSGHEAIDRAALAAVRRATFKPPPPGLTDKERTYEVPYHFR